MKTTQPPNIRVGRVYTPFKDRNLTRLKLTHEDENFYYFEDKTKYSKSLPFYWYEVTPLLKVKAYFAHQYKRQSNRLNRMLSK